MHVSIEFGQPSAGQPPDVSKDVALTAMSAYPNKHQNDWIFDTAASSYMTFDLGRFETFLVNTRTIEVAGETFFEYKGKGSCLVYPLYLDGTTSVVRLLNVLYVPTLDHNLILWNVLQNRFLCLMGGNYLYVIKILKLFHSHSFYMDCFMEIYRFLPNQNQIHSLPNQNQMLLPNQNHLLV